MTGSLFIEDAHDLSSSVQARVCAILEQQSAAAVTARVMAGGARDLFDRVLAGTFSPELFYRLNMIHLVVNHEGSDMLEW